MLESLSHAIECYFQGQPEALAEIPLDRSSLSAFQERVYKMVSSIPPGQVRSYGWVARQIGNPLAARAVGQALSSNPIPIVIPCHRVVASDGSLGGFSAGTRWKIKLLELEKNFSRQKLRK
jgi:methylated-DNA-[protein]-cysteine S-methyltransferase